MSKIRTKDIALDGLFRQNPTFRLVLGTCPTLAVTTAATNGVGMGLAVTFVLICSNAIISLLRNVIPSKVRIPAYILIIATFVTIVRMLLNKFLPSVAAALGAYVSLIVVNCIILGRAEAFASKNPVGASALDGLFMGLGFTGAITLMGAFREILGSGSIFGVRLFDFSIGFFAHNSGALFTFGLFIGIYSIIYAAVVNAKKKKAALAEATIVAATAEQPAESTTAEKV
ncbi:MAG TPA: electron transport complex subunit RsxE, partial [Clostridiales bacterium]|nr:electron transport complex subunit RsxE [Clostridiales bacterium]